MLVDDVVTRLGAVLVLDRRAHLGGAGHAGPTACGIARVRFAEVLSVVDEPGFALALLPDLLRHRVIPTLVPAIHLPALQEMILGSQFAVCCVFIIQLIN